MKNKNLYFIFCLFCFGNVISVSSQNTKKTNQLFEDKAYKAAASAYETLNKTPEILQNLSDAYYYIGDMEKAANTYELLIKDRGAILDVERKFRYGQALKSLQRYDEADVVLSQYFGNAQDTQLLIEEMHKTVPHNFVTSQMVSAEGVSEFGPSYYIKNQLVFASTRAQENPRYAWNDLPYLNLYKGQIASNGTLSNIAPFSTTINTATHESNATFSRDGKRIYFNRTDQKRTKIDGKKVANIKIYTAALIDEAWTNVVALPFNDDRYNCEHPSLSHDEKTLYFASDMPGSLGDFDIYKVTINDDGTYGIPENLGKNINTKQREQFPYISEINTLYFSSNGHPGLGGLDIFRYEMTNSSEASPVNLGSTANSSYDDFGFILNEQSNTGYLSSNRGGKDALFTFLREDNILTKYLVEGLVQDKNSKEILPGSLVKLLDENKQVIQDTIVDQTAKYLFKIEPNKNYTVRGTSGRYVPLDVDFSTDINGKISHNIYLSLESYVDAEETIDETEKGDVQVQLDRIFFDFDAWEIKPEAAITLNVLVDLMKKYDEMEVEVSAHTDARGPDTYNLALSKKRAAATLEYVVSQGIDRDRLSSIGYGEIKPLNRCIQEVICSDKEHDINRRCEFNILN
jgi:outer membrane protein OmpA-like peptidoglycan-associated protein